MKLRWRVMFGCFALLLVILLILVFSASTWLETDTGRNLLQRELSKGLGLNAELQGDYSFKLFPGIRIAGKQLRLNSIETNRPLAEIENYELHLALQPLLRKEILIHEVSMHDGSLDLDFWSQQAELQDGDVAVQLPKIESLVITGLSLLRSRQEFLLISKLEVRSFAENHNTPFSLELALPATTAKPGTIRLDGFMQLNASPFKLSLDVNDLLLSMDGQSWPLGVGELKWSGESGEFAGRLQGELLGFASNAEFSVQTAGEISLETQLELRTSDSRLLAARIQARAESSRWLLDQVQLELDGEVVAGSGCLSTGDEMLLQLQLRAEQLDLDALQDLVPANLLAGTSEADAPSPALPFQLAIALEAEQARMSGAIARDIRLLLGSEPDCTAGMSEFLN